MTPFFLAVGLLACLFAVPRVRRRGGALAASAVLLAIGAAFVLLFVFIVGGMH